MEKTRKLIKAVLTTKIQVADKKSLTSIPFFGYSTVDIRRKAILHLSGIGINFSEKDIEHFGKYGYLLIENHEVEFKLQFFN